MNAEVMVFDVETTYGTAFGRPGNPFAPGLINLCASGFLSGSGEYRDHYLVSLDDEGTRHGVKRGSQEWADSFPDLSGVGILVGHNIKFDLLWYWRHPNLEAFLKKGGVIWDTAYAEYLLSGQFYNNKMAEHLRPSLRNCCKRRGLTLKLDIVKALWDQGVRTEDINPEVLLEYLHGDNVSTLELYEAQVAQAERQNQMHMIRGRMEGLLATTEMEYNGLLIDLDEAAIQQAELEEKIECLQEQLTVHIPPLPDGLEFNWGSGRHLSALLFGGTIKFKARREVRDDEGNPVYYLTTERRPITGPDGEVVVYKSGKNKGKIKTKNYRVPDLERGPKTRMEDCFHDLPGVTKPHHKWKSASFAETGQYSTSVHVLEVLEKRDIPLVNDLLALREAQKDLGTYYRRLYKGKWTGMLNMVGDDGFLHHNLNHFVTKTTRLSSEKPNLQNIPKQGKSKVRSLFISRFGDDGLMVEGDYSQLEVVCKAVLSGDGALMDALANDVCFHCDWLSLSPAGEGKSYEEVHRLCKIDNNPIWKEKRQNIKSLTFGESFGAGIQSLCESTGMEADDIEQAIKNRKLKYPDMYQYDEDNIKAVQASRRPSQMQTPEGLQAGIGYLRTATDIIYHFLEDDAPAWLQHRGTMTSFKPTNIKNYPTQGLGGEVMQVALGRLFRWLIENDRFDDQVLLINTVHDCCWMDIHKSKRYVLDEAKEIMEDVSPYFTEHYPNVWWNTPFPTEFEVGPNVYEMEHI
jgi:DNA polymerase I-like protein with 3'-5' exonuclease and polymerase domains